MCQNREAQIESGIAIEGGKLVSFSLLSSSENIEDVHEESDSDANEDEQYDTGSNTNESDIELMDLT